VEDEVGLMQGQGPGRSCGACAGGAGIRFPLIRHARPEAVFAYRQGRPISAGQFLGDVAALAPLLPARRHVLNFCGDRYRFVVGVAAALCREQVSLLPSDDKPGTIAALAEDFPDLYCLTDGTPPAAVPSLSYPGEVAAPPGGAEAPALPETQRALLLFTSGSTGRPKPAPKSWGALVRSALAAGDRLGVGALPGAVIVGTVPHQHSYGFESTVLLALQHGLALQAERPFYPGDIAACLDAVPRPRILVTSPIHLRGLLGESGALPRADLVVSATAPLSQSLAAEAEARFAAPLIEIYGCSEAGQVAARRTAQDVLWRCFDGIALRQDSSGTWAAGPPVESETLLQDVIEFEGDGFRLNGRMADLVNIAGKRSSLAHLDRQLAAIDGVVDGAFFMPEEASDGVTRLMAFVVAPGLSAEAILAALRARIDAAFLPRPLVLVDALPRNSLGKLPREALLRLVAGSGAR
jgi:acyl-coenzyme A synthetase/AMP-(fatty) acid ligase